MALFILSLSAGTVSMSLIGFTLSQFASGKAFWIAICSFALLCILAIGGLRKLRRLTSQNWQTVQLGIILGVIILWRAGISVAS